MRHTRGFTFILVVLVLAILATASVLMLFRSQASGAAKYGDVEQRFARANDAFVAFVSQTGRLPCPADPLLGTGDEDRNSGTGACNKPLGTLPWKTIGLQPADAFDGWGQKLSYRVYTGSAGSLTQDDGTSMVDCDPAGTDVATTVGGSNKGGLCKNNKKTSSANFLAGKGLQVNDFGAVRAGIAYVIVSHGSSGFGGYTSANQQVTPLPTSASELANLGAAGPFVAMAATSTSAPESATHFDDLVSYAAIADVIAKAGRGPRTWP